MRRPRLHALATWTIALLLLSALVLAADAQAKPGAKGCRRNCPAPPPPPPAPLCPGNAREGSGTVVLTFDDGLNSHYAASGVLSEKGYCGTFYVIAGHLREEPWYTAYLSPAEVQRMAAGGQDIESHTMTHADLRTLSATARHDELARSRAVLEDITGKPVLHFSYPYGGYDAAVLQDTASVYLSARAAGWDVPTARYTIPARCVERTDTVEEVKAWVDETVATGGTLWLCFHGIDASGMQYAWTPEAFRQVVDHVAASGAAVRTHAQMGLEGRLPP